MLTIIFRVILALAHFGYVALSIAKSRWAFVRRFSVNLWRQWQPKHNDADIREESNVLERSAHRYKKLPGHLCIVLGYDERISILDLVRILGWCIAVGIPYVSFYDHDGHLKRNQSVFKTECEKTRPKLASFIDWGSHASSKNSHVKNGYNGFKRRTRVQMFSNADGKGEIVNLAQNLSRAVTLGLLKIEEINTELLDRKLRLDDTPDPDLVFVCGSALCTYGLLPWHTRTTEFFNLRSHRDVCVNDFTILLEKYGRCEQRYGK